MKEKNQKDSHSELINFDGDLTQAVDYFFNSSPVKHFLRQFEDMLLQNASFPYMDIETFDSDEEVIVEANLPPVAMEDIEIDITGRTLTLEIDHKVQHSENKEDFYFSQSTTYSHFSRSVYLPAEVDDTQMITAFHNGKLLIRIPKK
ncbi:Hsp20/alpha crystallin family protein [Bacillus sp. FJAT-42376]|uniref:Hsp20/alpha crystallin family protein n=1 Tax=Bacillus sp. FJAT-42376 TaxID=2014076 RepID=UPI000F4FD17C|nr:Hsp20/alpha crystallin family protein [Bacillus sp. FJAT-42376]AZB43294.1 Hsp20/alpha crystallin family protein [Bacillus sp. FJAT-42376]